MIEREKKLRRRREWQMMQELEKEHQKRKQMMISDFERKRTQKLEISRKQRSTQWNESLKRGKTEE